MQIVKYEGNRAVVINEQNGKFNANLYVNARDGLEKATITPIRWQGKTIAGALRFANKNLNK